MQQDTGSMQQSTGSIQQSTGSIQQSTGSIQQDTGATIIGQEQVSNYHKHPTANPIK